MLGLCRKMTWRTHPISLALEEKAGSSCWTAALPVDRIPTQNTAVPTTSLYQATAVPHNHLPKED